MNARFGPAGNEDSFTARYRSTVLAPPWLREQGLDAYEVQCGRGVNIGEKTARDIGEAMAKADIALSLHAPYYISLTNPEKTEQNLRYIRQSVQAAEWLGARRIVVHTGVAGQDRELALREAARCLTLCLEVMGDGMTLCAETMGKKNQLGTLEEVTWLCSELPALLPCVDFGHLYARGLGTPNTEQEFGKLLDELIAKLGFERVRQLHIHFSQIEFGKSGELRHLTLQNGQFGPDFCELAKALKAREFAPTFICESRGTQAQDACRMREIWEAVS